MKREAKFQLIKDLILAVVAWLLCGLVFAFLTPMGGIGFIISVLCAGVPFGWRWTSKIFSAFSFYTIVIKFVLSILLGWLAIFVVIIKDIINFVNAEY